jgi:hypothetical protein
MTQELQDALRYTQEQSLCYAVTVCHSHNVAQCRRYRDLMIQRHGKHEGFMSRGIILKAERLLADAEQIAELERVAGL